MSPALIPLIGPIINGVTELFSDPVKFTAETAKTKTSGLGAVGIVSTIAIAQTEEQAITAIVSGVVSFLLILYKKKKAQ